PRTLAIFTDAVTRSLRCVRDALPATALQSREELERSSRAPPPALTVPLIDLVQDVPALTQDVTTPFYTGEIKELGLFPRLMSQLGDNDHEASGNTGTYRPPWEYRGSRQAIVNAYLRNTPLRELFSIDVPFPLPEEVRFSGHWVLSPPGRGKTTLLHAMVMEDLDRPGASLILMDSKGDLIDPMRKLKHIQDRMIIIDPDPQNPVAINPLDIAQT